MTDFVYPTSSQDENAEFKVSTIQFGDGYTQRIPNGINNGLRRWSVQVPDVDQATADAIIAFFRLKAGATSFSWRPQGYGADVRVVCVDYSKPVENRYKNGGFAYTIRATFQETPV